MVFKWKVITRMIPISIRYESITGDIFVPSFPYKFLHTDHIARSYEVDEMFPTDEVAYSFELDAYFFKNKSDAMRFKLTWGR